MKAVASLFLAAVVLTACSGPSVPEKAPRAVIVRTLSGADGARSFNVYTGEVKARHEADLGFRIGGKLIERRVDVGAQIRAGQILARLDPQDARLAEQAAGAAVAAAEADVALARAELSRVEGLHARNFVSASALDTRRTALQAAEARLRQARAQASTAGNQAAYATLVADHDGVVTAAPIEAGQVVSAGQAVLRIARPDEREVLIHVPESRIAKLAAGAPAVARAWANPQKDYVATVREIAPAADAATRSYALRVSVADADAALPLGATASVAFPTRDDAQTLLPLTAVTRSEGRATAWIVDEASQLRPVEVQLGEFREDGVLVRGGLPEGARVVLTGLHRLVAGETVRPVDENAPVALDARK